MREEPSSKSARYPLHSVSGQNIGCLKNQECSRRFVFRSLHQKSHGRPAGLQGNLLNDPVTTGIEDGELRIFHGHYAMSAIRTESHPPWTSLDLGKDPFQLSGC